MQHALEAAGVEFLDGEEPGVQLRKGGPRGDQAAAIPVEVRRSDFGLPPGAHPLACLVKHPLSERHSEGSFLHDRQEIARLEKTRVG